MILNQESKKIKTEHIIKLLMYIGTMSFVSLGYISRGDLGGGLYRIIALCFAVSAIFSFLSACIIIANMDNKYTKIERRWGGIGIICSIASFLVGFFLVAFDAVFL